MEFYYRKASPAFLKSLEATASFHGLENIQNYLPIYTNFLNINEKNYNTVGLNSRYEPLVALAPQPPSPDSINDDDTGNDEYDPDPHYFEVEMADTANPSNDKKEIKNVFVKYSPLLDPIRFLSGKYSRTDHAVLMGLPKYAIADADGSLGADGVGAGGYCHSKVLDVNNSAYVDGFFTYLSSKVMHAHKFVHGLEYYGAFIGHKRRFEVDITDDVDFFSECSFFNSNIGKMFHMDEYSYSQMALQTGMGGGKSSERAYKPKLVINDAVPSPVDEPTGADDSHPIELTFDTLDEAGLKTLFSAHDPLLDNTESGSGSKEIENVYVNTSPRPPVANADNRSSNSSYSQSRSHSGSGSGSASSHDSRTSDTSSRGSCHSDGETIETIDTIQTTDAIDAIDTMDVIGDDITSAIAAADFVIENNDSDEGDQGDQGDQGDEDDDEDDEDDEDDDGVYVEIDKFPVNAIMMEECEDTLDALMENDEVESVDQWSSIFMQIIMTLIAYQKMFWFTHNDLHTNNVMFVETQKEYLYYTYNGKHYRVPTFGKIFKIIDFGRSVYRFKNLTMCSDSFHPSGDAATQYNFPPYMNSKKALLEPNFSFDLCRLACSMYDYFISDHACDYDSGAGPALLPNSEKAKQLIASNPIIALVDEWVRDDKGRNVLYKASGKERYPDFKLYKMIARTVHKHTPANQLANPLFSKYEVKRSTLSSSAKQNIMNIDALPEYFQTQA